MAFAHLFTGLSAVEEGVKSPGQPAFTHIRNETETGKRGNARKRKTQVQQTGPFQKKQFHQAQPNRSYNATFFKDNNPKALRCNMHGTDGEHASASFTKEAMRNPSDKPGYKGQNYTTKSNRNVNKQQQQQKKKPEGQKNQHQQKDRWRPASRGGSHQTRPTWGKGGGYSKNRNDKQDVQVKRERFMSQEFKDQNAVLVDGRLVCRHFLWGKCIKGDECQLEHVKGYNDLIKEVCKFYIQGFCTKEESCPYMHKSFPCKFFHRKGKCSQGANCRFSHEPLNDVTSQLLNETLKRDQDLYELTKKAEKEASSQSGQPENTDEPEIIETDRAPDTILRPLRPNFYNSAENAEKETSLCQTDKVAGVEEEATPPHASDAAQPHDEPVCYSVAAVLGPQLFKPFPSFFTTQESATSGSTSQSEVPYSVDAVLRSSKSVENPTLGCSPTPPTEQIVSYTPNVDSEEVTNPLLSSETHNEKVLHSASIKHEVNKSQEKVFKSLSPLQVHTGWISKTYPSLTLASRDYKKQGDDDMPESLKPAQRAAHELKLELQRPPVTEVGASTSPKNKGTTQRGMHLPADITRSVNSKSVVPLGRTNRKNISSRPANRTSAFKHPTQLVQHLSILTPDSQSMKPFCPSSGLTEFKEGSAVPIEPDSSSITASDSANSVSFHFAAKQPTESHLHSKKIQSGLEGDTWENSTEIPAECSSKTAHGGGSAAGRKKNPKRPFNSLFASPVTDTLQHTGNSVTSSSCPQGFLQSSSPVKRAVEPDKAPAKSFLSLFAAPLSAPPLPCLQSQPDYSRIPSRSQHSNQSVNNTSQLSNSKQRASNLETPLPGQVRTDVKEISYAPRSPNFSPENEDNSAELTHHPTKQYVNPICSLVSDIASPTPCGNSASTTRAPQQLPNISSHKGSVVAATASSVLKTLFLNLSPYQQDGEQQDSSPISVPTDSQSNSQLRK